MAMTECVIMRIEKAAIVRVLHDEPKFSEMFMSHLLARNARVEEDLVDQLFNSSEKRLARVLLLMANFGKEGKPEPVIAILGSGAFFGEGCLIGQDMRLATAVAMADSEVMRIGKAEMLRVLHDEPALGELFMNHLLSRNSRVEADLVDQLFNSSEKRLARTLLLLANFGKDGGPQPITTPVSQETLAEIIGTTRPRVSHFMNKFRKLGFISYNGHLLVHSSLLSVVLRDTS